MNILYLLGNGFDINAGLNTKATEFIKKYKAHLTQTIMESDSEQAESLTFLLQSINDKGIEYWSDFEKAFGEFSEDFEGKDNAARLFEIAFSDFYDFFYEYITAENVKANNLPITENTAKAFFNGAVSCCADGMRKAHQANLNSVLVPRERWSLNFITFNYTTLVDRVIAETNKAGLRTAQAGGSSFDRKMNRPLHIHGTLGDDHGLLIGIDSTEQLKGTACRSDSSICNWVVKPTANTRMGDLRQEEAFSLIDNANIICIYGMSLGETDITWWNKIASWLSYPNAPKRRLIICGQKPELPPYRPDGYPSEIDRWKKHFIVVSGYAQGDKQKAKLLEERTLVSLGTTAFNLFGN